MQKLVKQNYTTNKGIKKVNCYKVNISKEIVNEVKFDENTYLKVYAKDGKIILEKCNKE